MKHSLVNGMIACLVILLVLSFAFLASSCAPAVSQQEHDAIKSELAATKADLDNAKSQLDRANSELSDMKNSLAEPRAAWTVLEPKMELVLIIIENNETYALKQSGNITDAEADKRSADQWTRAEALLKQIGNEDLTTNFKNGWFEPMGTKIKFQHWANVGSFLRDSISEDMQNLNLNIGDTQVEVKSTTSSSSTSSPASSNESRNRDSVSIARGSISGSVFGGGSGSVPLDGLFGGSDSGSGGSSGGGSSGG